MKTMFKALIFTLIIFALISCGKKRMIISNVNVIPMTGETVLSNYSVIIDDGKIESIGPAADMNDSPKTLTIDGTGKYLIPGLCDMHVHIREIYERKLYIANGVTLVRNMWGYPFLLKVRKWINNGILVGPEIFTTGPLIDGKAAIWPGSFIIDDPAEVPGALTKMKKKGYDAIKVYDDLKPDVYHAIIETARYLQIPVDGHVPYKVRLQNVLNAGQRSTEHFEGYNYYEMTDALYDQIIDSGVWNCPTFMVLDNYGNLSKLRDREIAGLKYITKDMINEWKSARGFWTDVEGYGQLLKELYDRGANIVAGTDVGNPYVIAGFSMHDELRYMQQAGLTPYQVLLTATKNPAVMLGIEDRLGTIEVGKDADLVLLDKNPLDEIANTTTITGVMQKGTWYPHTSLQKILKTVEQ